MIRKRKIKTGAEQLLSSKKKKGNNDEIEDGEMETDDGSVRLESAPSSPLRNDQHETSFSSPSSAERNLASDQTHNFRSLITESPVSVRSKAPQSTQNSPGDSVNKYRECVTEVRVRQSSRRATATSVVNSNTSTAVSTLRSGSTFLPRQVQPDPNNPSRTTLPRILSTSSMSSLESNTGTPRRKARPPVIVTSSTSSSHYHSTAAPPVIIAATTTSTKNATLNKSDFFLDEKVLNHPNGSKPVVPPLPLSALTGITTTEDSTSSSSAGGGGRKGRGGSEITAVVHQTNTQEDPIVRSSSQQQRVEETVLSTTNTSARIAPTTTPLVENPMVTEEVTGAGGTQPLMTQQTQEQQQPEQETVNFDDDENKQFQCYAKLSFLVLFLLIVAGMLQGVCEIYPAQCTLPAEVQIIRFGEFEWPQLPSSLSSDVVWQYFQPLPTPTSTPTPSEPMNSIAAVTNEKKEQVPIVPVDETSQPSEEESNAEQQQQQLVEISSPSLEIVAESVVDGVIMPEVDEVIKSMPSIEEIILPDILIPSIVPLELDHPAASLEINQPSSEVELEEAHNTVPDVPGVPVEVVQVSSEDKQDEPAVEEEAQVAIEAEGKIVANTINSLDLALATEAILSDLHAHLINTTRVHCSDVMIDSSNNSTTIVQEVHIVNEIEEPLLPETVQAFIEEQQHQHQVQSPPPSVESMITEIDAAQLPSPTETVEIPESLSLRNHPDMQAEISRTFEQTIAPKEVMKQNEAQEIADVKRSSRLNALLQKKHQQQEQQQQQQMKAQEEEDKQEVVAVAEAEVETEESFTTKYGEDYAVTPRGGCILSPNAKAKQQHMLIDVTSHFSSFLPILLTSPSYQASTGKFGSYWGSFTSTIKNFGKDGCTGDRVSMELIGYHRSVSSLSTCYPIGSNTGIITIRFLHKLNLTGFAITHVWPNQTHPVASHTVRTFRLLGWSEDPSKTISPPFVLGEYSFPAAPYPLLRTDADDDEKNSVMPRVLQSQSHEFGEEVTYFYALPTSDDSSQISLPAVRSVSMQFESIPNDMLSIRNQEDAAAGAAKKKANQQAAAAVPVTCLYRLKAFGHLEQK